LTVFYTLGGSASNGTDYNNLTGSVVIDSGQSSATVTVVPVDDSSPEGTETVILTLSANVNYSVGSPNTATVTIADNDVPVTPTISLSFDGQLRDKVGQADNSRLPDGQMDGTFTVTLNPGSGNRTVTALKLTNNAGGTWDTTSPNQFWTLGAALTLNGALLNASNDSVNFPVNDGNNFKIFGADYQSRMFLSGTVFTLVVNFLDGSTATAQVTL
jgi:hypothetical protein